MDMYFRRKRIMVGEWVVEELVGACWCLLVLEELEP